MFVFPKRISLVYIYLYINTRNIEIPLHILADSDDNKTETHSRGPYITHIFYIKKDRLHYKKKILL